MRVITSLVAGSLLLLQGLPAWAAPSATFSLAANVPSATSVSITVSRVAAGSNAFTTEGAGFTNLDFGTLTFDTTNHVYASDHYWAVDYAASNGSGSPNLTFTYTEGTNPNPAGNGLGNRALIKVAKEVPNGSNPPSETQIDNQALAAMSSTNYPASDFPTGSFARTYIALCTGDTLHNDPSTGCKPFSGADATGAYGGSLAVTATVN